MFKRIKEEKSIGKKLCAFVLTVLLVFGTTGSAFALSNAAEAEPQTTTLTVPSEYYQSSEASKTASIGPRYNRILKLIGSIDVDAVNDVGHFSACVTAQTGKATSTRVKAVIQKKIGTTWTDYRTYYQYGDSWRANWLLNNIKLDNGYLYRLKVTGTVTYNNVSESDILYTAEQRA